MKAFGILLVLACAAIEAAAQICLKQSTLQPSRRIRWVAVGIALFGIEAVMYTAALQRLDVSVAYSLGASSFVFVTLGAAWWLGEPVPMVRRVGIACIAAGCAVLAT